jgi:hypothetical protein
MEAGLNDLTNESKWTSLCERIFTFESEDIAPIMVLLLSFLMNECKFVSHCEHIFHLKV